MHLFLVWVCCQLPLAHSMQFERLQSLNKDDNYLLCAIVALLRALQNDTSVRVTCCLSLRLYLRLFVCLSVCLVWALTQARTFLESWNYVTVFLMTHKTNDVILGQRSKVNDSRSHKAHNKWLPVWKRRVPESSNAMNRSLWTCVQSEPWKWWREIKMLYWNNWSSVNRITNTLASFQWSRVPSESSLNWWSLFTEFFVSLRLGACLIGWAALLTCCLRVDFGRQLPTNSLSVLVNDHFHLLVRSYGTVSSVRVTSASPRTVFRRKLKQLSRQSYPEITL